MPVYVVLRDLARSLPLDQEQATPQHLWVLIQERLRSQNLEFAIDPLHSTLEQGAAILLLDGLDEIPTKQQRAFVREVIAAFAERYPRCRLVITCRTLAYQDPSVQFEGIPFFELTALDEDKIDGFIEAWYAQLGQLNVVNPDTAGMLAARLRESVRRPDLWRLAPNPLLLTVMALVHTHKGRLPDARALLYEETVEILLWRWEQIKSERDRTVPMLRQLLLEVDRTDVDLKRILWKLAFDAHQQGAADAGEALADIGALQLQRALADLHPAKSGDYAAQIIDAIKLRAGLLIERMPDVFTFPHRTFQEYLAGSYLAAQTDFAQQGARLMQEPTLWREVILLAVNRLVYLSGDTDKPLALVAELCPRKPVDTKLAWKKAWLAGQVIEEIGLNRVEDREMGSDLLERVRLRLSELLRAGALMARERASVGDILDRVGDPRFRSDAWYLSNEPLLGFVEIPAGRFKMGTDISNESRPPQFEEVNARYLLDFGVEYIVDGHPQHQIHLPGYFVGRYPVTVAQFRAFTQATDYPQMSGELFTARVSGLGHRPMLGVFMWEAMLYCDWLTEQLRNWEHTPEPLATLLRQGSNGGPPWRVTLPTEAQWEKAARGGDGRVYPWGNQYDPDCAIYGHGLVTSDKRYNACVGCFPKGKSPYGCEDLSGIWNWTRTLYKSDRKAVPFNYPYDPSDGREDWGRWTQQQWPNPYFVLRGGSFDQPNEELFRLSIRCSGRAPDSPTNLYVDAGFRLAVAPIDSQPDSNAIARHYQQKLRLREVSR